MSIDTKKFLDTLLGALSDYRDEYNRMEEELRERDEMGITLIGTPRPCSIKNCFGFKTPGSGTETIISYFDIPSEQAIKIRGRLQENDINQTDSYDCLICRYVNSDHIFESLQDLDAYMYDNSAPDYMSVNGVFYEMDSYDEAGITIHYSAVKEGLGISMFWSPRWHRYTESPSYAGVILEHDNTLRTDIQYKQRRENETYKSGTSQSSGQ